MANPLEGQVLGFIGAGNMAEALARGLLRAKLIAPRQIWASDPEPARRAVFVGLGAQAVEANGEVCRQARVIVLAVKPQKLDEVLAELRPYLRREHLVVSIAAGARLERIEAALAPGLRLVRVMPNTPLMVGMGVAGVARGSAATAEDEALVLALFEAGGAAFPVKEEDLDAVTAVSGSGPAYFFYLTECLAAAGEAEGLAPEVALRLAVGTLRGAGELLFKSGSPPEELRRKVTSPGGTTEAAFESLERANGRKILIEMVRRAAARSRELARAKGGKVLIRKPAEPEAPEKPAAPPAATKKHFRARPG